LTCVCSLPVNKDMCVTFVSLSSNSVLCMLWHLLWYKTCVRLVNGMSCPRRQMIEKENKQLSKQNKCDYFLYILFDFFRPVLPWCLTLCMPWQKEYILCKKVPQEVSSDQPMHPVTLKFHGWMGLLCTTTLMLWVHFSKHVEIILLLFQVNSNQISSDVDQITRIWWEETSLTRMILSQTSSVHLLFD